MHTYVLRHMYRYMIMASCIIVVYPCDSLVHKIVQDVTARHVSHMGTPRVTESCRQRKASAGKIPHRRPRTKRSAAGAKCAVFMSCAYPPGRHIFPQEPRAKPFRVGAASRSAALPSCTERLNPNPPRPHEYNPKL
jgi:hypothetical protein